MLSQIRDQHNEWSVRGEARTLRELRDTINELENLGFPIDRVWMGADNGYDVNGVAVNGAFIRSKEYSK